MIMHESGEMYLETILTLSKKHDIVKAIDIAEHLGYTKPSVSRAVSILKESNYIEIGDKFAITLTEEGRKIAETIALRHKVLCEFFEKIGVDSKVADADACKIEHVISEESFIKIKEFVTQNK